MRKEEGLTKEDLGREEFLERAWEWKDKYGSRIISQLKKLGSSCDWERERFTMDEGCSKAVQRGVRQPVQQGPDLPAATASSTGARTARPPFPTPRWNTQSRPGNLLAHPLSAGGRQRAYLELATTRPETMLGDTAVAVNPNDERYKAPDRQDLHPPAGGPRDPDLRRRVCRHGVRHRRASRLPRAHDPNDFEVGQRHNLPSQINVFNEDAHHQRRTAASTTAWTATRPARRLSRTSRKAATWSRSRITSTTSAPATAAARPLSR